MVRVLGPNGSVRGDRGPGPFVGAIAGTIASRGDAAPLARAPAALHARPPAPGRSLPGARHAARRAARRRLGAAELDPPGGRGRAAAPRPRAPQRGGAWHRDRVDLRRAAARGPAAPAELLRPG